MHRITEFACPKIECNFDREAFCGARFAEVRRSFASKFNLHASQANAWTNLRKPPIPKRSLIVVTYVRIYSAMRSNSVILYAHEFDGPSCKFARSYIHTHIASHSHIHSIHIGARTRYDTLLHAACCVCYIYDSHYYYMYTILAVA